MKNNINRLEVTHKLRDDVANLRLEAEALQSVADQLEHDGGLEPSSCESLTRLHRLLEQYLHVSRDVRHQLMGHVHDDTLTNQSAGRGERGKRRGVPALVGSVLREDDIVSPTGEAWDAET